MSASEKKPRVEARGFCRWFYRSIAGSGAISARAIPYRGQPAAITDLLRGQVDFVSSDLGALLGFLKQGNLTAMAVLAEKHSSFLPDVPTAREAGFNPVILGGWIGIDGPAKLPADVLAWWNEQQRLTISALTVQEKAHRPTRRCAPP